ncbi:MAG TPA: winged helix-turn-helix domain-containing protein [Polyangiaceae bacterium]|jgi:DNA-binding winged helix-turn-helix (wHTH) protein
MDMNVNATVTQLRLASAPALGPLERPSVLSFPPFRLDLLEERLWKGEREVKLRRKPFEILRYLARNPRRLVTQAEIVEAVWGRVAMSESLVRTHMHALRHALGEAVIETVTGRGYRFIAGAVDSDTSGRLSRPATPGGARVLALVRPYGAARDGQSGLTDGEVTGASASDPVNQLADVLEQLRGSAIIVLIVAPSREIEERPDLD